MITAKFQIGKNESGFSLVELMVTVGIIGVLATVAVPQYSKFTAKAKQSEAKTQLGGIYTVEKAFIVEGNSYTSCLSSIGFGVEGSQRRYAVGFNAGTVNVPPITCSLGANSSYFAAAVTGAPTNITNTNATTSATAFNAHAVGAIGTTTNDQWSITDTQTLTNFTSGI